MDASRRELILNVWPDKLLFASLMLLVAGIVGAVHAAIVLLSGLTLSGEAPPVLRTYPPAVTLGFGLASVVMAFLAMRRLDPKLARMGAVAGFLSFGLLGLASFFALLAGVFLLLSAREDEAARARASGVHPGSWPDKSLAASTLLLVAGALTLAWAAGVLAGWVAFGTVGRLFALVDLAVAALCFAAARAVYVQRGARLGLVASVAAIVGGGAIVLAPLLGVAAFVALRLAAREGEFEVDAAVPPVAPAMRT